MREKVTRNEEMRQLKAGGVSAEEIAARYNVSTSMVYRVCRGISSSAAQRYENQYTRGGFDQIDNFCRMLEDSNPSLEYVSGFTSVDKPVALRCKVCGCEFTRSAVSVRHRKKLRCPGCDERDKAERERVKASTDEAIRKAKRIQREADDAKIRLEREKARIAGIHNCPVCGKLTDRKKYCSAECANKRHNQLHETRRRVKIQASIVDKDITLEKLYERDGGVCWICGLLCDWEDRTTKGKAFIAGNYYPSIDHVVALADGGAHSWENVKLAHRTCNSFRYYDDHGKGVC